MSEADAKELRRFARKIGYDFRDESLLAEAATHSTYANENGVKFNERLEFLGDAVLELVASKRLFLSHEDESEGELTRRRANLVCKNSLSAWANEIGLKKIIRLGRSLAKNGATDSIAADCAEALFGAIYIDGGFESAERVVTNFLEAREERGGGDAGKDAKTELQERCQKLQLGVPRYEIIERSGPDHAQKFKVRVTTSGGATSEAEGSSTQEAEFEAARRALRKMRSE